MRHWLQRRAVARSAIVALMIGLMLLAGLAFVSARSAAQASASVAGRQQVSQQWNEIYLKINIEYELLVDFLDQQSAQGRSVLTGSIGSAEENLRWLNANGGPDDSTQARSLQNTYSGYSYTLRNLVDATRGDDEELVRLQARQAALSAAALRKQASNNIARNNLEIGDRLREAQRESDRIKLAVGVISTADLALVVFCSLVLLVYQRSTERQAAESRYRASHDALTGVANRDLLTEGVEKAIARTVPGGSGVGLLLIDLNRFKEVNDTLGHHAGDLLLQEVARRLTGASRGTDVVARLGGDEFAVLLSAVDSADEVMEIGRRMLAGLCGPAELEGLTLDISGSIGVAFYPSPSTSAAELLQHADVAMYAAKRGHSGISMYDPEADSNSFEQLTLLGELRRAIENGELELHYQPKVRVGTRALCGAEALVRWRHPARGLLGPHLFVPTAEQSDLMRPLTEAVLEEALAQHRRWRHEGLLTPVSVNVGASNLLDPGFPARVAALMDHYGTAAGQLTIEITESALVDDPVRAATALRDMRDRGVLLSIDDFGTGYSSMSYLQVMPLDELKIDRQFTTEILSTPRGRPIVTAMVELAHALGLQVVVEGVEDERTHRAIGEMGCEVGQGYLFCRPLPPDEFAAWAAEWSRRAAPALS
ncbi:putative bifunctional diguanylate cyclase/phosphodiesterase [Catenuloplanes indicus]|uniref:Diguanylate cyclase (GGDEF)-like protein n=1 Tax=Catenuloplanes indicus TaxID=137267 RepID=A0AAE3VX43_9ACTN|nr:bifunctional diguanylate cyclase/phosphodiesterase [Catenuloplanes indicus]MDQ0364645.1 diguanylate cyclase (GGDEF)-like protein [Catenuloplanes indicus]